MDGELIVERINGSESIIKKERVEGLDEIERKAIEAFQRPGSIHRGGEIIQAGINTATGTDNAGRKTLNAMADYVAKTADYTIQETDNIIDCTANTFTISLPALSSVDTGRRYEVVNSGTGVITIDPNGTETVDGCATSDLYSGDVYTLAAFPTQWKVI
jgi:hypothetical protein